MKKQEKYLPAKAETRIKQTDPNEIRDLLLQEIYKLYLKNGQKSPESNDAAILANELYDHIMQSWPGVKIEWIQTAFKNGISGKYGDFANISFRIMVHWINEFRHSMTKKDYGLDNDGVSMPEKMEFIINGLAGMPNYEAFKKKQK